MTEGDSLTPSLLEPESRGGDIAESGFSFQDHIILTHIPTWLAQEGFTAMVKEGIGDVEAKFFVPGHGFIKELLEIKDHQILPSKFWSEIKRFQEIDTGSPDTYRRFTLISTGASKELHPLINQLNRIRGSQDFYEEQDAVKNNSIQNFIELVEGKEHTKQDALFLLNKVMIEIEWNTAKHHGEAVFKKFLIKHFAEYGDLSARILDDIYNHLSTFVRQQRNLTISRKELEKKLREKIPPHQQPPTRSILIYTATSTTDNPTHSGLHFDWTAFSGGETRASAPPEQWDQLLIDLQDTRTWIENYRNTKRIKLLGNRRVSPCLAIGSVFSAVRGYAIDMEYRGEIWATDAHPTAETPAYPLTHQIQGEKGDRLVVSISIYRNIVTDVQAILEKFGLTDMPLLDIQGEQPITSPEQANLAVRDIKNLIIQSLRSTGGKTIHLFYAGLAPVALFLGHRLDATAPVICYGWIGDNQYSQTCQLFSEIIRLN